MSTSTVTLHPSIANLVLSPIVVDRIQYTTQWSDYQVQAAIAEYKEFLQSKLDNPELIAPSLLADIVWHQHILATKEYIRDCDNIFGGYLHHTPTPVLARKPSTWRKIVSFFKRKRDDYHANCN